MNDKWSWNYLQSLSYVDTFSWPNFKSVYVACTNLKLWIIKVGKVDVWGRPLFANVTSLHKQQTKKSIRHHSVTNNWWHNDLIWCWSLWGIKLFFKSTSTLEGSNHIPTISTQISDTMSYNQHNRRDSILQTTLCE